MEYLTLLFKSKTALAATIINNPTGGPVTDPKAITALIGRAQTIVSTVAGIAAVAIILYGGFLYLMAGGDEKKLEDAKKVLTYGLVGAVLILLAGVLIKAFIALLGGSA